MDNTISKTLITGGGGMTASYVNFGHKFDRKSLDVTNIDQVLSVCDSFKPKTIIHLAAATNVDKCEKDPAHAYAINTFGTYNIAIAAKRHDAKLIYVSTAGVFDGKKKDPYTDLDIPSAEPQNHYSKSKYLGEIAVKQLLKNYVIFRTGWLFGGGATRDHKFVGKVLRSIISDNKKQISSVDDTRGTPTYCKDLVTAIKQSIQSDLRGSYLLGNEGTASRYEIALEIVKILKSDASVSIVDASLFKLNVKRIASEAFSTSPIFKMRPWQKSLKSYIKDEWLCDPHKTE